GLAQALSVTFSTVSRWENGHVKPSKLAWKALEELASERGSPLVDDPTDGRRGSGSVGQADPLPALSTGSIGRPPMVEARHAAARSRSRRRARARPGPEGAERPVRGLGEAAPCTAPAGTAARSSRRGAGPLRARDGGR